MPPRLAPNHHTICFFQSRIGKSDNWLWLLFTTSAADSEPAGYLPAGCCVRSLATARRVAHVLHLDDRHRRTHIRVSSGPHDELLRLPLRLSANHRPMMWICSPPNASPPTRCTIIACAALVPNAGCQPITQIRRSLPFDTARYLVEAAVTSVATKRSCTPASEGHRARAPPSSDSHTPRTL
jgi:hypothetical protein